MKAYLILADGTVFSGSRIGAKHETIGEAVFTTAMCGYMETLTDPSYYGQLVAQTFPLIGNYGEIPPDRECPKPALFGYIVRELVDTPSNYRSEGPLEAFLERNDIPGIQGIDTRRLTRILRSNGIMNAMITDNVKDMEGKLSRIRAYGIRGAVEHTSASDYSQEGNGKYRVAMIDYGAKANIVRELLKRDCTVIRVPYNVTAEKMAEINPDGIMLTNGGGDPAENKNEIAELKKMLSLKIPTFGICLGHQLLALASGAKTKKLKYGHRGANQPVKDTVTGRTSVTSQNHGYAVVPASLPEGAFVRYTNANDRTCEGIDYRDFPAFSVQFHPEACGGPLDTKFLFDRFTDMMRGEKNA